MRILLHKWISKSNLQMLSDAILWWFRVGNFDSRITQPLLKYEIHNLHLTISAVLRQIVFKMAGRNRDRTIRSGQAWNLQTPSDSKGASKNVWGYETGAILNELISCFPSIFFQDFLLLFFYSWALRREIEKFSQKRTEIAKTTSGLLVYWLGTHKSFRSVCNCFENLWFSYHRQLIRRPSTKWSVVSNPTKV